MVTMTKRKTKRIKTREEVAEIKVAGIKGVIKVGDDLLLKPRPGELPYVARVTRLETDSDHNDFLLCRWYYRPEDTTDNRKAFHGAKEVFISDHVDEQTPDCVLDRCRVLSYKEYTKQTLADKNDYFCRFEYATSTGAFTPEYVAVFCTCELPCNPDDMMVQCGKCKEWYHPRCVNLTNTRVKKLSFWQCATCGEDVTD